MRSTSAASASIDAPGTSALEGGECFGLVRAQLGERPLCGARRMASCPHERIFPRRADCHAPASRYAHPSAALA
jgi:hypothetical protein